MSTAGKIMRSRRIPEKSPYSRPENPPEIATIDQPGNPNWISGLISPAKVIVSGAGKILSFFGSDSPSSSDDDDQNSDNNENEEVENDLSPRGESLCKVLSPSSKNGNKHAIKQLVMKQKFSREEGHELIKLIKSRIVDADGSLDENVVSLRTEAITEAQKWLQQKRSGSKKKMEHELDITTLTTPSMFTEIGKGSPVDMAKSYMQNRPTWTSATKHTEYGSSSSLGIVNFKEGTPKSTLRNSEMKRSFISSGNILEEVRRVRSKATVEFLAATPLTNTVKSSFFLESNRPEISVVNNRNVEITDLKSDKDEVIHLRSTTENDFPSNASGLNAELDASENAKRLDKVNNNLVGSVQIIETDVHITEEDITNPEQESAADICTSDTDNTLPNGSQNSSSMQLDDEVHELSERQVIVVASKANVRSPTEARKSIGYTRRGRPKSKGK